MNKNIVIISRDCFGYQFYKKNDIKYNTITIGNYMHLTDFFNFCSNLDLCKNQQITLKEKDGYVIGEINIKNKPINIHFVHDNNKQIVEEKYKRRLSRFKLIENPTLYIFINDLDLTNFNESFTKYINKMLKIKNSKIVFFCNINTFNSIGNIDNTIFEQILIIIYPSGVKYGTCIYNYCESENLLNNIFTDKGIIQSKSSYHNMWCCHKLTTKMHTQINNDFNNS